MNTTGNFMEKVRTFLGFRQEPPRNDFRNPIWGSDDDDDDDELYSRQQNITVYGDIDIHNEVTRQVHDIFKSFGTIFGDMRSFFQEDQFESFQALEDPQIQAEDSNTRTIRDYYLKPGFHNKLEDHRDIDLDGKISSQEISGLLKKKEGTPFDGTLVPGGSFCKTIITTSVTKPDGTIETRKIVKSGNDVIEDTIVSGPDTRGPFTPGLNISAGIFMADLNSFFRNHF